LSVNGSISATGTSSISLAGRNIIVTANISTQAGDISLVANDGNYQEGSFDGVLIDGSAVNVNTTGGNIGQRFRRRRCKTELLTCECGRCWKCDNYGCKWKWIQLQSKLRWS
jgi:hypothetical protein